MLFVIEAVPQGQGKITKDFKTLHHDQAHALQACVDHTRNFQTNLQNLH